MPKRDVIVIGASAGGVEALKTLVSVLPANLPAAVLVVLHIAPHARSVLPAILERAGQLRVSHPHGDARLVPGTIYVAPPDHHLTVREDAVRLTRGPRINGHRPAVDPLFQTAARALGPRVMGVVLSGVLDDGTDGMLAVKLAGGVTLVQSPEDALYPGMPRSVLEQMSVDHILPAAALGAALVTLAGQSVSNGEGTMEKRSTTTTEGADGGGKAAASDEEPDEELEIELGQVNDPQSAASGFTCPECHGALWNVKKADIARFRCRVGHAYTPKGLFAAQSQALDEAVWAAYRALQESASLSRRLATRARSQGLTVLAERYDRRYTEAKQRAELIRDVLERGRLDSDEDRDGGDAEIANDA